MPDALRLHFPEDEARLPWLPMLLDAYAVIDKGVSLAVNREKRKGNRRLACSEGCGNCCRTHTDIPLYELELLGIYWYVIEKMKMPLRGVLREQLAAHTAGPPCPFLIDSACSIYSVRPVACRQFMVFTRPCDAGEDPFFTRRSDLLTPIEDFTNQAFFLMLPFYGIKKEAERTAAIKNKVIHTRVRNLQEISWKTLAVRMDDFDK